MKIVYSLSLFLQFGGIFCTEIVRDSCEYGTEIAEVSFIPDSLDVFILVLESKRKLSQFKNDCNEYGGNRAYDEFKRSVKNFVSSAIAVDSGLRMSLPEQGAGAIEEILIFIKEVCPEFVPNLLRDTKILISSYWNCLTPEARRAVPIEGGLGLRLFEYICRSNGSHILGVFEDSKSDCQKTAEPAIDECMSKTSVTDFVEDNAAGLRMNFLTCVGRRPEYYNFITTARDCYIRALKKCRRSANLTELIEDVNQIIDEYGSCHELQIRTSALKSSAHTIDFLSTTGLISVLIYSRFV